MKNILIIMSLSLFLVSCSSYYTTRQFSSKEKFYEDFNDFAKNKNVEVTLINDSSFTILQGARISNDTLILKIKDKNVVSKYIPIDNIKEIYYKKNWPGIITGTLSGFLISFAIAGIGESSDRSDNGFFGGGGAMIIGVPIVTILGGVIGWFVGYDYTYIFNP